MVRNAPRFPSYPGLHRPAVRQRAWARRTAVAGSAEAIGARCRSHASSPRWTRRGVKEPGPVPTLQPAARCVEEAGGVRRFRGARSFAGGVSADAPLHASRLGALRGLQRGPTRLAARCGTAHRALRSRRRRCSAAVTASACEIGWDGRSTRHMASLVALTPCPTTRAAPRAPSKGIADRPGNRSMDLLSGSAESPRQHHRRNTVIAGLQPVARGTGECCRCGCWPRIGPSSR